MTDKLVQLVKQHDDEVKLNKFATELQDSDNTLCQKAADVIIANSKEIDELKIENGHIGCMLNDLNGQLLKDTCNLCNWLERGDCHQMKQDLRNQLEWLWANCHIVYFPPHPAYPLEHSMKVNKNMREHIEAEMK